MNHLDRTRIFEAVYQAGMEMVAEADATLQAAFDKAAAFIDEKDLSVKSVKAMTHALGIWHWLGELRIYIVPKYNSHNVPALLEDLAFDADSYLNS